MGLTGATIGKESIRPAFLYWSPRQMRAVDVQSRENIFADKTTCCESCHSKECGKTLKTRDM